MGSGKSTVAGIFVEHGYRRLDSDQLVREEVLPDPEVIAAVEARFGRAVVLPEGGLDRSAVAGIVFNDDEARLWLEELVHPRLFALWRTRFSRESEASWVVEVPLLFEKGLENWFDFTICVATSYEQQLARLEERGIPRALAGQRISKQLPLAQKLEHADYVLLNDGSVDFLHEQIVRLLGSLTVAPRR